MKIAHICLAGPFSDGFSYQENLLTKYHARLGNEVTVFASEYSWNNEGKLLKTEKRDYINADGIRIIRLEIKGDKKFSAKFKKYKSLYKKIEELHPQIIFVHGANFSDLATIKKYLKNHRDVITYLDNHCDRSNSGTNFLSYNILHKVIWKYNVKRIEPYIKKFYGVMPSRVKWLIDVYNLPEEKCELLVMGADDDLINKYKSAEIYNIIRQKYKISNEDFLIVTGGKIDPAKYQTLLLMKAINKIKVKNLKLLIFGSVGNELKKEFYDLCNSEKIEYFGWADNEQTYMYFSMADLIVFPGRHSVFWEEAVALQKPLICKYWEGTTHVDIGGNVKYLYNDSVEEIEDTIFNIINNKKEYANLKKTASSKKSRQFLYSEIAKKSLEID